jgi:hemin uptake protein HemP
MLRMRGSIETKPSTSPPKPRRIGTAELMGDARELVIEHGGEEYRLRITSNGKLILTK